MPITRHSPRAEKTRVRPLWRTVFTLPHVCVALLLAVFAARAEAQFIQYVAPGTLGSEPQSLRERLEAGSRDARYRLGRLRLDPLLHIRDMGYQSNVFADSVAEEEVSDTRVLVAGGLNGYLPLGPKAMAAAFVIPEYSWWAQRDDLRQFNVSAGGGLFGFFNRLALSVDAQQLDQESVLNAEVSAPVQIDEERISLGIDVEIQRSLFAFATFRSSELRYSGAPELEQDGVSFAELDRDYQSVRGGLRFELGEHLTLGFGGEETSNDFLVDPRRRSNEGTSPFVELRLEEARVSAQLTVSDTEVEFAEESILRSFSSATGIGLLSFRTPQAMRLTLYGSRNVVFSARETTALFLETRLGMSVERREGQRLGWRLFVESGELEFSGPDLDDRVDDLTGYGVNLTFDLTDELGLVVVVEEVDYESSLPGFDRAQSTLGLRLAFRDNLYPF